MIVALLLATAAQVASAEAAALLVVVENVPDDHGVVRVDVCDAASFLGEGCARSVTVKARKGAVPVDVGPLPPGDWAIQAYHDRDENGRVTRNRIGAPVESFGFSRAPPLGLHGPKFDRAAFPHGAQPQTVTVKLRRLF